MGLFMGFLRPAQELVAHPSHHNDIVDAGAAAMAAGIGKTVQLLAHLPPAPTAAKKLAASNSRVRSAGKRKQLNIRVSCAMHQTLKAAARRRRLSLTELVAAYCEAGLAADRQ